MNARPRALALKGIYEGGEPSPPLRTAGFLSRSLSAYSFFASFYNHSLMDFFLKDAARRELRLLLFAIFAAHHESGRGGRCEL